jgi:uncharacterized protein YciI
MSKQYAYFYFMKNEPERIGEIISDHVKYWEDSKVENYSGGPFGDRSGGLILFEAEDIERATSLAFNDPFVSHDVIENKWLKEWIRK